MCTISGCFPGSPLYPLYDVHQNRVPDSAAISSNSTIQKSNNYPIPPKEIPDLSLSKSFCNHIVDSIGDTNLLELLGMNEVSSPPSIVKAFLFFKLAGAKAFQDQINLTEVDIFELFQFAHYNKFSTLEDCCTNLISTIATDQNLKDIQLLAEKYDNAHLKKLVAYLGNTSLGKCIASRNYKAIIESSELFWNAYYEAILPHQDQGFDTPNIKQFIEEIRSYFLANLKNEQPFEIILVQLANKFPNSHHCFAQEKPDGVMVKIGQLYSGKCYLTFVQPALKDLARRCGLYYTEYTKQVWFQFQDGTELSNKLGRCIQIHKGSQDDGRLYPIPPKNLPDQPCFLYQLYKDQSLCDIIVQSNDGQQMHTHSAMLRETGGDAVKAMLMNQMKEMKDNIITFPFSAPTIQAYLEYVYLGGKIFLKETDLSKVDLGELLDFAYTYQVLPLIDCCTNIISTNASGENLPAIEEMAKTYDNEHLRELVTYLKTSVEGIKI